ncbi:MAG: hypothetical protein HFJ12_04250 [Bacilli bacterium]|nr:hypothetical protein [Bacilli bacterium]
MDDLIIAINDYIYYYNQIELKKN